MLWCAQQYAQHYHSSGNTVTSSMALAKTRESYLSGMSWASVIVEFGMGDHMWSCTGEAYTCDI